ncbi:MAG: FtsW/RodA/SpoVE family cell cycle protein, partial [Clostridia bacterium]|nr:FtsW/RodA/SpoVE family cell cycle protein [Clostridia bacterium]
MPSARKRNPFFQKLLPSFPDRDAPLFHTSVCGIDPTLLILILLLAAAGTLTIFSAGFPYAENRYHNGYYFIERQIVWVIVGIGVMLLSLLPSSRFWYGIAPSLYLMTVLLLLSVLAVVIAGNGAQRWIAIGPLTFQPSEFAKTSLVLMLARYYAEHSERALDRKNRKNAFLFGTLFPFLLIGAICILVLLQKHLSGLIILGCIGLLVMLFSGISLRYVGFFGGTAGIGVAAFAFLTDYTKRRITIWLNPEKYP